MLHGVAADRCPTLKTAISDIEVDLEQVEGSTMKTLPGRTKPVEFGVMHRVRYQVRKMPRDVNLTTSIESC